MSNLDFRQIYFYEFKLGRTAAQPARNINEVWGQGSVNECTVQRWFQKFRAGNASLEDEPHGSRLPTLDNEQLKASVEADPHKTLRDIAKELNVHHTTIVRHLKQTGKTKKLDKWVPHESREIQKNRRFEISSAYLLRNASDPFLERIVTCDEKWILYDNRRRSAQWLDQKEAQEERSSVGRRLPCGSSSRLVLPARNFWSQRCAVHSLTLPWPHTSLIFRAV
uniref:HTH_48 domain-containing protein n=1 Tax=Haemonchus contortus TaxID=6289 RepID=A0A7I4Y9V7_HAECO